MKEDKTTNETMYDLMALYDIRIKKREDELNLMTTTFLAYCKDHVQEDGFEEDTMHFLLVLFERKESLKALKKEHDILCGKA